MNRDYTPYEWNRLRYDAVNLWKQGLRSGDHTIILLQYGYSERDTEILCLILKALEESADAEIRQYNPEIGF